MLLVMLAIVLSTGSQAQTSSTSPIDFSKADSWIAFPENELPFQADVFYIYPTVFFGDIAANMELSNNDLREKARGQFLEQASVFQGSANLFAPYYRQVSLPVLNLPEAEFNTYFDKAYQDVKAAWAYYLQHSTRPFILAGHSQGSEMILKLMEDFFEDEALQNRLIATYAIGYTVSNMDLKKYPWLKIAENEDEVGAIITYNTQSPDATGSPILLPGARCVNPLLWNTSSSDAKAELNKGAVFFDDDHKITNEIIHYTNAQCRADGALIVDDPDPDDFYTPDTSAFPRGVFHAYDYHFFYRNLQQNASRRIIIFLDKHAEK
jgi:hypothetical protein